MTVRELRHLLFDIGNQEAEVKVMNDLGDVSNVEMAMAEPSDAAPLVVYLTVK